MYWEEDYYESTVANNIFENAKNELMDALKREIKDEIQQIKDNNKKLEEELATYRLRESNLIARERDVELKENQDIASIYRKKFSEILKPIEENLEAYRIGERHTMNKKCNKCNDNRMIEFKSAYGDVKFEKCGCYNNRLEYFADKITISTIDFYKNYENRKLIATPKYEGKDYDDKYFELKFKKYINEFDISMLEDDDFSIWYLIHSVVFTTEDVCQKYCDYLNKK